MRALVARTAGGPLRVEDVELPAPGRGEVRVRVRAAGVCHSDLSMVDGTLTPPYPLVLGHEAAGEVIGVGDAVSRVTPGDHVVLNWAPACRQCWYCGHGEPWLCSNVAGPVVVRGTTADGEKLHVTLGLGALAEEVVVPENAVVPVPAELPFDVAALLGCAVLTGFGAVRRTAGVRAGESVAVIGLGGVGLAAVSGARAAGADPVVAIDVTPSKQELAFVAGATDFLLSDDSLIGSVRTRTGGRGVDHAFECVGGSASIRTAWRATRRGGNVIVVGMGARDDVVGLSAFDIFHSARTLRSSMYGSSDPDRDVPELAAAVLDGSLDLSSLISHRTTLDGAMAAFERMARGHGVARTVVIP